MKKISSIFAIALSAALLLTAPAASAWDGALSGKISSIDVAPGSNYGFRIILSGTPVMCTGGQAWAYLNDTDSNYKTYVAMAMLAKAQGSTITIYTTLEGGYCHIGYISVGQ